MRHVQPGNGRHAAGPRPSETAQRRLVAAIDREVGDLRVRVHEGLLRSEILLEMGRPDEAAEALDESRMLVDQIHERLSSAVAAAAVEREAEAILAAVDTPVVDARPAAPSEALSPRTRMTGVLAALASAAAGLLFLATPSTPQDTPALSVEDTGQPAATTDADAADVEVAPEAIDARAADRDSSLAAAALAAIEQHTAGEPGRDPVAAPAPPTDGTEPPETDGDWLQELLNVRFDEGPTAVLDILDPVLDALPEGGPPVSETIDETRPPVDDDADAPAVPDAP